MENELNSEEESNFDTNRRRELIIFLHLQFIWKRIKMIKPHFITSCESCIQLGLECHTKNTNLRRNSMELYLISMARKVLTFDQVYLH